MSKKTAGLIALTAVLVASQVSAQELRPVGSVMPLVKQQFANQCAAGRERLAGAAQGFIKEQASSQVKISCDCMPGEIERAEADLSGGDEKAMITQEAFLSRMRAALSACTAKLVRAEIGDRCERESTSALGVSDKKAYCGCVSERVQRLDDETLVTATTVAQNNFRAGSRARAEGKPEPMPLATPIDQIKESCKKTGG